MESFCRAAKRETRSVWVRRLGSEGKRSNDQVKGQTGAEETVRVEWMLSGEVGRRLKAWGKLSKNNKEKIWVTRVETDGHYFMAVRHRRL